MIKNIVHQKIISKKQEVKTWFQKKSQNLFFPFYSSIDLRDSGSKVVPIDVNLFPAGFNNICDVDKENLPDISKKYLHHQYRSIQKIILLAEEHTKNPYYWDNIQTLSNILKESSQSLVVCVPGHNIKNSTTIKSAGGHEISVELFNDHQAGADLVICNNDFSLDYSMETRIPFNPEPKMGWRYRKKNWFFEEYNPLAEEFAHLIGMDPWHLTIKTQLFKSFDPDNSSSLSKLSCHLETFLKDLKPYYKKNNESPYAFLKNNSGTYGLSVISVDSSEEIKNWNYKTRKQMKASKGGGGVSELILQEGIPTILHSSKENAEPVIYMIGPRLVGGFLRAHRKKGVKENLNSPGAVYKRLCVSDLKIEIEGNKEENVYGWVARLAALALGFEIKKHLKPQKKHP